MILRIDLLQTWDTDDECNPSEDEEKRENERKKTNRKWKRGEGIGIGSDGIEYKLVILPHSKLYKGSGLSVEMCGLPGLYGVFLIQHRNHSLSTLLNNRDFLNFKVQCYEFTKIKMFSNPNKF